MSEKKRKTRDQFDLRATVCFQNSAEDTQHAASAEDEVYMSQKLFPVSESFTS